MLTYIEISKNTLLSNIKQIRTLLDKDTKLTAVIKANAYGHDQNIVAQLTNDHIDYFQVDSIVELRKLREVSKKPTLVLGYVAHEDLEELIKLKGTLSIFDQDRVVRLNSIAKKLKQKAKIHIKIDAQLGRLGILPDQCGKFAVNIKKLENIDIEGIYMHFANIEDTNDPTHAKKQLKIYKNCLKVFNKEGIDPEIKHTSATSGILVNKKIQNEFNMVRLGIGMYGLWPSKDLQNTYSSKINLSPVLQWKTRVAQVKTLPKEHNIGYGLTYTTKKPTKIAIIPQGYSDGYDRKLSNKGEVLVKGERAIVLGRIAMNMFAVDVTHIKGVGVEDEVILIGSQNSHTISAEELADKVNTINYEIISRINPLIPRVIVN